MIGSWWRLGPHLIALCQAYLIPWCFSTLCHRTHKLSFMWHLHLIQGVVFTIGRNDLSGCHPSQGLWAGKGLDSTCWEALREAVKHVQGFPETPGLWAV